MPVATLALLLALQQTLSSRFELVPSPRQAEAALLYAMTCRDEDGFTNCDVPMPVKIEFSRFDCISEPPGWENGAARASCVIAGRVKYHTGIGRHRWQRIWGNKAGFWLPKRTRDVPRPAWQAFSEPHR